MASDPHHLTPSRFFGPDSLFSHIETRAKILVAVSGGLDSVVLLHLLYKYGQKVNIQAVHVNHHLRAGSHLDQDFVESLCQSWDIPRQVFHGKPETRERGKSIEMWARRVRYEFMERAKFKIGAQWISTAHHGNDQVETILMNLERGCGMEGLRGIPAIRGNIIRPLLPFSRKAIQDYANSEKLNHVEDETNENRVYRRNAVRHTLVKPWEKAAPDLVPRFFKMSQKAQDTLNRMNKALSFFKDQAVSNHGDGFSIDGALINKLSPHMKARLIKSVLDDQDPWRQYQWEGLTQFLESSDTGNVFELKKGWSLWKDRERWILNRSKNLSFSLAVEPGKSYPVMSSLFSLMPRDHFVLDALNPWREVVDGRWLKGKKITLRNWEEWDSFQPLGMKGRKKVSDYLVDIKMNRLAKKRQLVLTAGDEIIWLCGQRISEKAKVTSKTDKFMELSFTGGVGVAC